LVRIITLQPAPRMNFVSNYITGQETGQVDTIGRNMKDTRRLYVKTRTRTWGVESL